ncbi:MAG TPA: sulfotransferase [Steroidobacteraceae bacterium]|jgi:tetratricopeptide (TPR) repeat protein|nr:sulfotransferase [Steroidobacteraceae bacterium]
MIAPLGTIDAALANARSLIDSAPQLAADQATEILKVAPGNPAATLLLGVALHRMQRIAESLQVLQALSQQQPQWAIGHYELGLALAFAGRGEEAVAALRRAVAIKPDLGAAWLALGDHLTAMGESLGADAAYAEHIRHSSQDPRLLAAGSALCENRVPEAERLLREHLKVQPTDVAAIRMLAEVAARLGRYGDAENLLARCLELAPGFRAARHNYAVVLHRQSKSGEALTELRTLLRDEPRNPGYRFLHAALLARIGDYEDSLQVYADVLADYPNQAKVWMSYGHALKTVGKERESIDAYRKTIELAPTFGEAYWSLANLKTFRFTATEVDAMRAQLANARLDHEDRFHLHFTLGKACEDDGRYRESFDHYAEGNRLRRVSLGYDAAETTEHLRRSKALFTPGFFAARAGWGATVPDPIFIVGLPRSGSTLIEQILSSHSLVEGTMELPDVQGIARELGGRRLRSEPSKYPEVLAELTAAQLQALGQRYLQQTRIQRKTSAPFFIDKMPNNLAHVGLIHLMLPNAKIIDARRHPLGCCFSAFKQHFARGQGFSYSLADVGHYYRDYVELMAHFDRVLPGRVHRVFYEDMIDDTEGEVRRLLAYCGLDFEEACLHFHRNERAVRTASSQQVRQPIYRDAVEQWRNYDSWLDPLKRALGPVLERYPQAP